MKLLILGGTLFVGRHLVEAARSRGHEVTLFNRGLTDPDLFPDVETLRGDRDGGLEALEGRRWDAVVDTSGYVPRVVRASATILADAVDHYAFVSSGAVYADFSRPGIDESAPVRVLADETVEDVASEYGALKAACERTLEEILPGRVLAVRAGLIVGPYDPTERFAYWVRRVERGGEVLAPGDPDRQVQLIHGRDLADWILTMAEARRTGVYNATGPSTTLTMGELLEACRAECGSDATFVWVDGSFLLENEVAPFSEMPLWLPDGYEGMLGMNVEKALAAGLSLRPLAQTIRDTLEWDASRTSNPQRRPPRLPSGIDTRAGLAPEREEQLLEAWRSLVSRRRRSGRSSRAR